MKAVAASIILAASVSQAASSSKAAELAEVRQVYDEVRLSVEHRELQMRERKFEYCGPGEDDKRRIYLSASGVPRLYVRSEGSEDHLLTSRYYYDAQAILRFLFITGGAFNGTRVEHRVWFSKDGTRLKEKQTLLEGPGYTFPDVWPEEDLVRKPLDAFGASSPCKEVSRN